MSEITTNLRHALDIADAWLKGGDPTVTGRRVEEARDVITALVNAVIALDTRLDRIESVPQRTTSP